MKSILIFSISLMISTTLNGQLKSNTPNSILISLTFEDGRRYIHWETPREINSSYFIIERSWDGEIYEAVHSVKAAGYSNLTTRYTWEDVIDTTGSAKYRITLVMMDGIRVSKVSEENAGKDLAEN